MKRLLITGSRKGWPTKHLESVLLEAERELRGSDKHEVVLVEGGAKGVDHQARIFWTENFLNAQVETHEADWAKYGKSAGPKRNAEMVAKGADLVLAFIAEDSRGTKNCARLAADAGLTVRWFHEDGSHGVVNPK